MSNQLHLAALNSSLDRCRRRLVDLASRIIALSFNKIRKTTRISYPPSSSISIWSAARSSLSTLVSCMLGAKETQMTQITSFRLPCRIKSRSKWKIWVEAAMLIIKKLSLCQHLTRTTRMLLKSKWQRMRLNWGKGWRICAQGRREQLFPSTTIRKTCLSSPS